ncbi:ABC transporter ATP-binding protein/permease [Sinomonas terrae]|uniref:ATP-binding cassette domain-containing protein n=1 Tax=Sinomonas terrae TaxID=2908838 RepID=A0ABS9U3S3_9MICC|nr:ATP-binding cassette domain-containing protein [Sinomonas terrae]MCH6471305.1 ATP-binding cassette domain-containing protein [Sinomonas terrae]
MSLDLAFGEMVAVHGSSGSGKSTLLNILGLLTRPDRGQLVIDGHDVTQLAPAHRAAFRLGRIAFVFQAFHLVEHMTVAENIALPLLHTSTPKDARRETVDVMIEKLGLGHRKDNLPRTLSGGEKQRVAIGRALVTKPTLLLCDEPTGSLDSVRSREVVELLRNLTGPEQATVIVTHDEWVAGQCDRTVRVEDGRIDAPSRRSTAARRTAAQPLQPPKTTSRWALLGMGQALRAVQRRAGRNFFTMLGVTLGVAALVLTVALSATISAQLSDTFNLYLAQRVTLKPPGDAQIGAREALSWEDSTGLARLKSLNGVEAAGVVQDVSGGAATITPVHENRTDFEGRIQAPVMSTSRGGMQAMGLELVAGRLFDAGHIARGDRVAVLSESVFQQLGRTWVPGLTVFANNTPFSVIGLVKQDLTSGSTLPSVFIPLGQTLGGEGGRASIMVKTAAGAASQVAAEGPVAWNPARPGSMTAAASPEPKSLRKAADANQQTLMIGMAAVTLVIGAVGTMNTFLVAVLERRREIGLRMALGSSRLGMMVQFATESVLTAGAGAVLGVVAAINILAVTCLVNHWVPVFSPESITLGLAAGLVIGLVAGVYPAMKAAQTDPVVTLSHG